jgi:hypothetical protein
MFQKYLALHGINLPVTRLGGGFYMFGTKKIFCKIMNNNLVVRVGGGFMGVAEFIQSYGEKEVLKISVLTP